MELWIPITIAAAFVQNVRSGLQRHLRGCMGTTGATFVRFGYGLPIAFALLAVSVVASGAQLPAMNRTFVIWTAIGASSQIAGQALLVMLFTRRSFVTGSAYARTEPVQAVIFGLVFLSDRASTAVLGAIAVSMAGVILLTVKQHGGPERPSREISAWTTGFTQRDDRPGVGHVFRTFGCRLSRRGSEPRRAQLSCASRYHAVSGHHASDRGNARLYAGARP